MENKKRVIAQGILGIFLVATFFSCGCINTPTPTAISPIPVTPEVVEVEKIVYIDRIVEVEVEKIIEVEVEVERPIGIIDVVTNPQGVIIDAIVTDFRENPQGVTDEIFEGADEVLDQIDSFLGMEETYTLSDLGITSLEKISELSGIPIEDLKNNRHEYTLKEMKVFYDKYNLGRE